ncbi:MAG: preprotein translocase subunit SecG [Methylobacteriaceae bacterium]|nr:preprotein translocase subunit SecG [Methylobacteriaceae bacterium]
MQTVLIVIHLMVVAALVVVVLLQRSEGGALGIGGGGGGGFFTGRGQANALTRATAVLATIFFLTSIALTVLASMNHKQKSIFEGGSGAPTAPAGTNAPPPLPDAKGGLFDQLQKLQDQKSPAPAPAPAPTGPQVPKSQ